MKKILLKNAHPELAEELVDKSLLLTLGSSSRQKVEWKCEKGHKWYALVNNRVVKGYGCPYCSGRLAIPGETDLATLYPDIAKQLLDQNLASELKPTSHKKVEWMCDNGHVWVTAVADRISNGSGCPYCSGRLPIPGKTDLATTHPELSKELVNVSLATKVKAGTNKKLEWECSVCGYHWFASPNTRTYMNSGCPKCAGKVVTRGINDLATLRPDLAAEVVDKSLLPRLHVTSNQRISWKCSKGHIWENSVGNRTQFNQGCPLCAAASHASKSEQEFADTVAMFVGSENIIRNDRTILPNNKELDIVIKNLRLAFEFNGVFWHSTDINSDADLSHIYKSEKALDLGYHLIHIWEDDWKYRRDGVISVVREFCSNTGVVYNNVFFKHMDDLKSVNQIKDFIWSHSLDRNIADEYFACFNTDGVLIAALGVCLLNECVCVNLMAGLWSIENIFLFLDYVAHWFDKELSDIRLITDKSYADCNMYHTLGFEIVDCIAPKRLLVGQESDWKRIEECECDLDMIHSMRQIYDCGYDVWKVVLS